MPYEFGESPSTFKPGANRGCHPVVFRHGLNVRWTRMAKRASTGSLKANAGRRYLLSVPAAHHARMVGWGHARRALRNAAMEQRRMAWRMCGVTLWASGQCADLTDAREHLDWLRDLPAQAAQQALRDLDKAYQNWWDPEHPAGAPTFERKTGRLSFRLPGQATSVRHVNRRWSEVWVPKLGWLRLRRHRQIPGEVRSATFTYTPGEGWHVSFGVAAKERRPPANREPGAGVDFGVECSAFVSAETKPRLMPPSLTPGERSRLLGLERRKARQLTFAKRHNQGRYSNRLRRTIADIAKLKARQARRRRDFTHKLTCDLAKNHGWVAVEDLRVKSMSRSARGTVEQPGRNVRQKAGLNRAILDNIPGERRRQLAYKTRWYGSQLRLVPAAYSSQQCSQCGLVDPTSRPGCGREFACVACGDQDHADHNAAKNIERRGARGPCKTAGPAGAKARNSTGRHKPSRGRKTAGGSVKPTNLVLGGGVA